MEKKGHNYNLSQVASRAQVEQSNLWRAVSYPQSYKAVLKKSSTENADQNSRVKRWKGEVESE